jgi:hypothetical protein
MGWTLLGTKYSTPAVPFKLRYKKVEKENYFKQCVKRTKDIENIKKAERFFHSEFSV